MRILLLLSLGIFVGSYAMEQREEPVVCGSVMMGYCMELIAGRTQERTPLMVGPSRRGNIQEPEPIEARMRRECYQHNRCKIWCCGMCCCLTCSCVAINIASGVKTMSSWCDQSSRK